MCRQPSQLPCRNQKTGCKGEENDMKKAFKWLAALCAVLAVAAAFTFGAGRAAAAGSKLDLSKMQIVLPAEATAVEQSVAAELNVYLEKMTGSTLPIVPDGQSISGKAVYIGATQFAAGNAVAYPTDGDEFGEGWAIRAVDGNLVLTGAPTRGVLYAVYHLLEDGLGVRWWTPWDEDIPTGGSAEVAADYNDSGVPAFEYRDVFIGVENKDSLYFVRNRVNGFTVNASAAYGGEEDYGYPAHTHTFNRYFPPYYGTADMSRAFEEYMNPTHENYFETHPEWFALKNGERIPNGQLCLTNVKEVFKQKLLQSIEYSYAEADAEGRARPRYFSVVPNDSDGFCECESCTAVRSEYGLAGELLLFVNDMAAAVKTQYPEVLIEMPAYWHYIDAPEKVVPADNVEVRFAANATDLLHDLNHANNAHTLEQLQKWAALCGASADKGYENRLYFWQYVVNYNNNGIFPSMYHYGNDFALCQSAGVDGWFAEQESCINTDFWDMKLWLITKQMENPVSGSEYQALMDEFLNGYYGAAGPYVKQYLDYMHEKAEAYDGAQNFGTHIIGAEWLHVQDILAGEGFFDAAFEAAVSNETLLRRLRAARSGFDRVVIENFARWTSEALEAELDLPFSRQEVGKRLYAELSEQVALRGDYDGEGAKLLQRYSGYSDTRPALPEALEGIDPVHVYDFTSADFTPAYGDPVVEDAASLTGSAVAYSYEKTGSSARLFSGSASLPIYIYSEGITQALVGSIPASELAENSGKGYQLYEFEFTMPSLPSDAGALSRSYAFVFDDWGLQNRPFLGALQHLQGKTAKFYLSMRITGDVTGADPDNLPVYYVDRMIVTESCNVYAIRYTSNGDGTKSGVCPVCGKTVTVSEREPGALPAAFDGIDPSHIYDYKPDKFNLAYGTMYADHFVKDEAASSGRAAVLSAELREADNNHALRLRGDANRLPLNVVGMSGSIHEVAFLTADDVIADGAYHLYKFENVVPIREDSNKFLYIFDDWGFQIPLLPADLAHMKGKPVDFYLSMKVTGDVSCEDAENYPVYSIDRVVAVERCESFVEDYPTEIPATCMKNAARSGVCTKCSAAVTVEIPDSTVDHVFTSYVPNEEQPCTVIAYCDFGCGTASILVDKSGLNEVISAAEALTQADYTAESWAALETALSAAKAAAERDDASAEEVFAALSDLQAAMDALKKPASEKPSGPSYPDPSAPSIIRPSTDTKRFPFADVASGDWFYSSVRLAWENRLIDGTQKDRFSPRETLTVAQAIKLAAALHQLNEDGKVTLENGAPFWYSSYVDYAVAEEIIDAGYAGYTAAQMNAPVSRAEFIHILYGSMPADRYTARNSVSDNAIPDIKTGDAYAAEIYAFYRAGILTGSDQSGTFRPASSIQRCEVAAILVRMFKEAERVSITLN